MPEPFAVVSVEEMRALEAAAMVAGTHERVLQERAGLGVADAVEAELGMWGWSFWRSEGQKRGRPGWPRSQGVPVMAMTSPGAAVP